MSGTVQRTQRIPPRAPRHAPERRVLRQWKASGGIPHPAGVAASRSRRDSRRSSPAAAARPGRHRQEESGSKGGSSRGDQRPLSPACLPLGEEPRAQITNKRRNIRPGRKGAAPVTTRKTPPHVPLHPVTTTKLHHRLFNNGHGFGLLPVPHEHARHARQQGVPYQDGHGGRNGSERRAEQTKRRECQ